MVLVRASPNLEDPPASDATAVVVAARPGDAFSALSAVNSNVTRSTGLHGVVVGNHANPGHSGGAAGTARAANLMVVPEVAQDYLSYQVSGNSRASLSGEYSHGSVAFYSEPLQCPDLEAEEDEEANTCWWQHGSRGRQRGAGTAASARLRGSPSLDRLERLRRWQGTTEVHRTPALNPPPTAALMNRSPRL